VDLNLKSIRALIVAGNVATDHGMGFKQQVRRYSFLNSVWLNTHDLTPTANNAYC